ncbi:photosystem I P700 apoprotein A2 [Tanacetum coccineum]|uniref:Photosystem I P700 apoprotein A2 n=1 Tax=Tanacetum coccineum TaxID=301880 RepID=A0ABQ5EYM2_9ASTR
MGMYATKDRVESDTSTVYSISLYESTITTRDEPWFGELKLALGVIGLPVTIRDRILRIRGEQSTNGVKPMWNGHEEKEGSLEEKQPSSFPSLPGPKAVQGESGASRSTVERKIFGPSSFSTGFQTFLQHRFRKGRGTQTFFAQSSITINGWLHDFLWAQASQEDLKGIMALRFPRFSQGLAQDPTTRRIWFGIATAHDFESHDDITEEPWQGNFESWVQDPLHVRPIAHAIWDPHFCQPAVEAFTRGGALGPVNIAYSGVYQWWYTIGLRTNEDLYTGALFLLFISAISLIAGWLHLQPKWKPSVSWFKNAESRLNHHLSGLFGVSSLAWTGHLVHVAIPASRGEYVRWNNFLDVLPHPQGLGPLFTGQWNLYAQNPDSSSHLFGTSQGAGTAILTLLGGFHPQTQSLWLTDMAHHHLAIAFIFLIAGHMYRTNFGIGHSMKDLLDAHIPPGGRLGRGHKGLYDTINNSLHFQLGLALASLGVITSLVAQHMYSLPAYAFIAQDFTTQAALYTHHQYIAGFIMTGAFAHGAIFFIRDYNPEQNEDNVLARMLEHKEAIISHLSWASLFLGFHTLGLYVHNDVMLAFGTPEKQILIEPIFAQWIQSAHGKTSYGFDILLSSTNGPAFNAGRSIWLPGWLNAINENSNSLFLTIGPGDFLVHHAIALGLHTTTLILVKGALDARGSKLMPDKKDFGYSFPCDGPGRGVLRWIFGSKKEKNGYWQELIETLAWAHERTPLANLIRWREKPVALSIVQARLLGLAHFSVGYILTYAVCLASIFPGLLRAREMELLKQLPLLLELLPKGGNWLLGRAAALGKEGKVFHSIRESWYLSIIVFVAPVAAEPLCCWFDPAGHAHGTCGINCMRLGESSWVWCSEREQVASVTEQGKSGGRPSTKVESPPYTEKEGNLVGESLSANLVGGTCSTLTSLFHNTSQPAYLEGADTRREEKGQGVSMRPKKGNESECLHCIVAGYLSLRSNNRKSKAALSYGQCPLCRKE